MACLIAGFWLVTRLTRRTVQLDSGYHIVMGTYARIVAVAEESQTAVRSIDAGLKQLTRIDCVMSDYKPDSQLSKVNRDAYKRPVKVSRELFEVFARSTEFSKQTDGAFDITVGPLVDLWRQAGEANQMPTEQQIVDAEARVGYTKLLLDASENSVRFAVEGMRLDLGGIAKGYAIDKAVEAMKKSGATGGMVDVGGDIRCFGLPKNRKHWLVGLQDPNELGPEDPNQRVLWLGAGAIEAEQTLMRLKLNDAAVATSGDYQRFAVIDGRKFSHIINTQTPAAESELPSVTIIAPTAVEADALATAVTVLGAEKGLTLIEQCQGVEAILISSRTDSKPIATSGASTYISR